MVAVRQVVAINQQNGSNENAFHRIHMDAPRLTAMAVCCCVVYIVCDSRGFEVGLISAVLTVICAAPLFNSSSEEVRQQMQEDSPQGNETSQIFAEVDPQELDMMREEEHSVFGRMLHEVIEILSEDVQELIYVAQVLSENKGLLILLSGGVSSMVMALVAGLDDVNVLKALLLSITCYGITTILVARSARRIADQRTSADGESKLSFAEVQKIIEAVPEEDYVPNNELENCDLHCIEKMLHRRNITISLTSNKDNECDNDNDDSLSRNLETKKKMIINELRQKRNYNECCCICLSSFNRGETIRVLPGCHHEFHQTCIDKWAQTFAEKNRHSYCSTKRGRPTCPLCNTCLGETQGCLSPES